MLKNNLLDLGYILETHLLVIAGSDITLHSIDGQCVFEIDKTNKITKLICYIIKPKDEHTIYIKPVEFDLTYDLISHVRDKFAQKLSEFLYELDQNKAKIVDSNEKDLGREI